MTSSRSESGALAGDGAPDAAARSLIRFLRGLGAGEAPHAGGRTLLEHLIETYEIVRRWDQPAWLQHAALAHSLYGTDAYHRPLLPVSRRTELAAIIGERAERLAYLFGVTARGPLFAGMHRWARTMPVHGNEAEGPAPTRPELDCVLLLHMANLADQARARDGSPGRCLVKLRELGELLADSEIVRPPLFHATLAALSPAEEEIARRAYLTALSRADASDFRASQLALAATASPVVAEPCVWLGYIAVTNGDQTSAEAWGRTARARLELFGTTWDKRLRYDEWWELANDLGQTIHFSAAGPEALELTHPRALLAGVRSHTQMASTHTTRTQPDPSANRERFHRYVEGLCLSGAGAPAVGIYPDLVTQPWYEPGRFSLARCLESDYPAIREELLALDPSRFRRESESIPRSGEWDVVFLYERGRPNEKALAACPVTGRTLEFPEVIRSPAGLAYVSRMRGGTHIAPHRGPTNLRVRCHLGIEVPDGDCAIRVGEETRAWQEGKCLVFDDHFEHEAWNHTAHERIVLIVDLWHPALSATETALLLGLQRQMYNYARRLGRYWSNNER